MAQQLWLGGNTWAALSAVATLVYVIFSALLWRESIRANQQAENAHKEATRAFEFNRELWRAVHRPFIAAVQSIEEHFGQIVITVVIHNKSQTIEAHLGGGRIVALVTGSAELRKVHEMRPMVLVPGEKLTVTVGLRTAAGDMAGTDLIRRRVLDGSAHLEFEISVPYAGLDGQLYDYYRLIEYRADTKKLRNKLTLRPPLENS